MREVTSDITGMVRRAGHAMRRRLELDCDAAQELMSPFIDSMASPEEVERLQSHVSICEPCQRQLQSFISIKNLLSRIEQPPPPEDLALETRVLLSQERNKDSVAQFENRLGNLLKPLAIPAIFGVSLTMLCFVVLLTIFSNTTTVMARDNGLELDAKSRLYELVRTTDSTMAGLARSSEDRNSDEPLMIETHVSDNGKVLDYQIIEGPKNPETDSWVKDIMIRASFTPATSFGKPVDSKIILSFMAVKG